MSQTIRALTVAGLGCAVLLNGLIVVRSEENSRNGSEQGQLPAEVSSPPEIFDPVRFSQMVDVLQTFGDLESRPLVGSQREMQYLISQPVGAFTVLHSSRNETVQLKTVILDENGFTNYKLKTVNLWNQNRTLARLYLSEEGDFMLQADLIFTEDTDIEVLRKTVERFLQEWEEVQKHLVQRTPV